ncbi:hypothetical protein GCM10009552_40290 [Rothia nasimurium]|uniref:Metallo-beta-lactamase domain-containing protein n=1 Tax=Luteibacter anthropi TaxID=564369 RepID=A0A7X5ZH97_9GAMM|nr:hypothetical protein [Luteibacter anthropi]NII05481.1 hypothetical protein [Luteibacter anthropi]
MPANVTGYRELFGEPFWQGEESMDIHAFVSDGSVEGDRVALRVEVALAGSGWARASRGEQERRAFFADVPSSYAYQVVDTQVALALWGVDSIEGLEGAERIFSVDRDASSGQPIQLMRDLADAEGVTYRVRDTHATPRPVVAALEQPMGDVATEQLIAEVLAPSGERDLRVAVLDVGQGAAAFIGSPCGLPHLYFDIGGGESNNQHTWPNGGVRWCFTQSPPIILSHWHRDHYAGATYGSAVDVRCVLEQTWIAPDQKVGAKTKQLQARILAGGGRLILWPSTLKTVHTSNISVGRASGTAHNDSGLVLLLRSADGRFSLLPGDAAYQYVDPSIVAKYQSQGLKTLVVAHHGGLLDRKAPANVPCSDGKRNSVAVYSAGSSNSYNHPSHLASYTKAGWASIVGTDSRMSGAPAKHLGEPGWGSSCHHQPCLGNQCSLSIWR